MKRDIIAYAAGSPTAKRVSKETLNHRGLIVVGIGTVRLATGTPAQVRDMVLTVAEQTRHVPGFALSSCGGLHGDIPLANLEAYFDARAEIGVTPPDWRTRCRREAP